MSLGKLNIITVCSTILLSGCFGESNSYKDLDDWMAKTKKEQVGKIKPLPIAKEFTPVEFRNPVDPFQEKQTLTVFKNDRFAPDMNRRKEPLEDYPLDALKMTGFVINNGVGNAMITTPDKRVHYVTKGNHMGQNFGEIIQLDEGKIKLEERVKEAQANWAIKNTTVYLIEQDSKR